LENYYSKFYRVVWYLNNVCNLNCYYCIDRIGGARENEKIINDQGKKNHEYNNQLTLNNETQLINNTTDKINTIFNYFNRNPGKELTNIQIKNILEKED